MGHVWGHGLARDPLGAPGERQQKKEHGEAFVPAHHFVGLTRTANVPRTGSSARQPISAGLITHPVKPSASTSFDDLVGTGEDRRRHGETKRLSGLEIDDQLEFGRLLHRQIGGLLALEYPSRVNAGLVIGSREARCIADQATGSGEFARIIDRRNGIA